jgi:histone-lysine N-methyltransferase SETMAR
MDLEKIEHRAVIKFLVKEGITPKIIHDRLQAVYEDRAPSYYIVKFWANQFKWGRQSLEDDPRSGRPSTATDPEMCRKVEEFVLTDRRIKVSQIATEMGISHGSVFEILHNKLGMSKVSARWVPKMLTAAQREMRVVLSQENLDLLNADSIKFFDSLVTGDETWVHYYDPETKNESMQWKHLDSPPPRKFRTQPSAGKLMATVFWDIEGLLLLEWMPNKTTITGTTYAQTLRNLRCAIKEKRRGKLTRGVLLLHDNAPSHTSRIAKAAVAENKFQELNHPPYSPDLAPSDFFLFRNMKKPLRGRRFQTDEEVKAAVIEWFEGQEKPFFENGLKSLKSKWEKCVEVAGDYIEKL